MYYGNLYAVQSVLFLWSSGDCTSAGAGMDVYEIQLWNIHHVVVIPENTLPEDYDPQFFIDEINRANRETIPEEEWLSDRLYYVDYKKKKYHLRTFV